MPHAFAKPLLFAAAVVSLASGAAALESIAITEYMQDPSRSNLTDEWVELYNFGATTETLAGWHLRDDDNDNALIPTTAIGPGEFLILARNKAAFEELWLDGAVDSQVVQISGFALNDGSGSGSDEIVLVNAASQIVWRLGYGPGAANGNATFLTTTDLSSATRNNGSETSSTWISRNGNDLATGIPGYEGNEYTSDPRGYFALGGADYGSPLRGAYAGAHNPQFASSFTADLAAAGMPINQGIRGLAISDQALNRGDNTDKTAIIPSLERVTGSSIRGVAGGLYADMYDWKRRNDMPRPPTLEYMRWARNTSSTLYVTANIRGLTEPDPEAPGFRRYYTSDTLTLANLAADWVRYTNHIVQTYRQGDPVPDSRDAAILSQLTWSSSYVSPYGSADQFSTLLAPGETPVPPVTWWEIGNEPTVSLNHAFSVTNGFTFATDPAEYGRRYKAITEAMLGEDPTIKVGPCVVNGRTGRNADEIVAVLQSGAQVDFISYHPYGKMDDWLSDPIHQQAYLDIVYPTHQQFLQEIKDLVQLYRPELAATMRYVASETNVSNYPSNNTFQEGTMAHALGSVETVMSFARLGLDAAHYWIWIAATPTYIADSNRFPVTMAWEKMRDELADRLVGVFDANPLVRLYVLRDTQKQRWQVWALNFSDTDALNLKLHLQNGPLPLSTKVTSTVLQALSGGTRLFSANLNPEINNGVVRRDVDWSAPTTSFGQNMADWTITLPAATLTLYTIEASPTTSVAAWPLY